MARLTRRFGGTAVMISGLVLVTVGMAWFTQLSADVPYLLGAVGPLILLGLGQGITFGPLTAAGVVGAPPEDAGAATVEGRVTHAYLGGTAMLAAALVIALAVFVPAELAQRRKG